MACICCFCSESGMILMVKASDRSLVMENTALMALKATRTWGESEVGGRSAVVSCNWTNKRLLWADSHDVTWLLIGIESESESCQSHLQNVLALVCETYNLTMAVVRPTTARDLKHYIKRNLTLNEIIDFLVLGFSAPSKGLFADVTGFTDSAFLTSDLKDIKVAMSQLVDDAGMDICFLLHRFKVMLGDTAWYALSPTQKQVLALIAQLCDRRVAIHLNGVTKQLITFQCRPTIKLVAVAGIENEGKLIQSGLKFCRKNEKGLQNFEDEEGPNTAEFFSGRDIQGFLVLHGASSRNWWAVRTGSKSDDERGVIQRIQKLRQIYRKTEISSGGDNEEIYEINRSYSSYATQEDGYKVLVLLRPEITISTLITFARSITSLVIQKLNSSL